ncbi:hypothetical protein MMC25_005956 [Agyrium rufum]|nr:hypothetical protein [Agyrium rufum]
METLSSGSGPDGASKVCTSCKRRKRRCNKAIPACSSCSKRGLACKYPTAEQALNSSSASTPAPDPLGYNFRSNTDVTGSFDSQGLEYPDLLFMDPSLLLHGQIEFPLVTPPVPSHVLELLGDEVDVRAMASKYFHQMNSWMPFISERRFYAFCLGQSCQSRPEVVLLLLCLKLITTLPPTSPRNPRTPLYKAVTHYFHELQGSGTLSMIVLQAGVLIALYEVGHAIYPAAYLSIGTCARYGQALDIGDSKTIRARKVTTLVDLEERRRVWWAVIILDRFVNIGCPGRTLATANPGLDDLLPTNDAAWADGIVRSGDSFRLSSPMPGHMSKFALLCQAARLLGQVLQDVSINTCSHEDHNEWIQLDRTLHSMLTAASDTSEPDNDQMTFVYSTLVALHLPWFPSRTVGIANPVRSQRARSFIREICDKININLVENRCYVGRDLEDISPWGLSFAYQICVVHVRCPQGLVPLAVFDRLRDMLIMFDSRWNAAGSYLLLLEALEVMAAN